MEKQYKRTNLLQEKDYNYRLQDVPEPVLYRDMFSYDNVPKVRFNHRVVPMYFPDESGSPTPPSATGSRPGPLLRHSRSWISIS